MKAKKAKSTYRVQLKVGDTDLSVEGAESGVVKIVEALADVLRGARRPIQTSPSVTLPAVESARRTGTETIQPRATANDIRSFFEDKKPSSDIEAAAAAAYYYQYVAPEEHRQDSIDSAALQEAFRLARRPLPARTIYTLTNARNAGYLDSLEGGQFRLNPVGYNLVEHGLGQRQPTEESKKRKKKKRKAKRRAVKAA